MATRASDIARPHDLGHINELPVIAADIIYEGSAVGDNGSGYARPLVAGDPFRGFAQRKADNATGSAGDINIRVLAKGKSEMPVTGLVIADVGKDVFASDDDTFLLTQGANTRIGYVHRFVSAGVGIVAFNTADGVITELTDSTTGTANNTVVDVGGAFNQATLNDNFADVIAKINGLTRRLGN